MFTVVIAEKEHLDSIRENHIFLDPFIDKKNVAFCEWRTDEQTLREAVPKLEETVSRREHWRAVIVCNEDGLNRKNPFDLVDYTAPIRQYDKAPMDEPEGDEPKGKARGMNLDELTEEEGKILDRNLATYLAKLKKAKFTAFEQAVQNPLTRLVTYLCQPPLVTNGINRASLDPEFNEYLEENAKKQELRAQILNGEKVNFSLPDTIYCVAKRTYMNEGYDIPHSWTPHEDLHYSRFFDQNMYFDRMRYFVFDILPRNHSNYAFDYIRFLFALLILSGHEAPTGSIRPERVYNLQCENDEDGLDELLSRYQSRMSATITDLKTRIRDRESKQKERLSDREANSIFCANVAVPVSVDSEIDTRGLLADINAYKLSGDCPQDEHGVWKGQLQSSKKTLRLLLKQPRRALKKATGDMHRMNTADFDKAMLLNEFQLEDLEEHIQAEELKMVTTPTMNLMNPEEYDKKMQEADEVVCKKIETRMSRKITLALCGSILLLYLIGFLPLITKNLKISKTMIGSLSVLGIAFGLLVVLLFVTLICLRRGMRQTVDGFNDVMRGVKNDLDQSMMQYSRYLSSACNVMRGNSVLNYRDQAEDSGTTEVRVMRKHVLDLEKRKAEIQEIFGRFITGKYDMSGVGEDGYEMDFYRTKDYEFDLPMKEGDIRNIEFIENGNLIRVPVRFVKSLKLQREELYDT
ncbi:MAG: hypothetical protein K6A77_13015 [Clostridiales bacterium]|nr:hypothetical protein [Clostridiales bacterium]